MDLRDCFNPCFIGTYSFTIHSIEPNIELLDSFNPCFIGTYSFTIANSTKASMSF